MGLWLIEERWMRQALEMVKHGTDRTMDRDGIPSAAEGRVSRDGVAWAAEPGRVVERAGDLVFLLYERIAEGIAVIPLAGPLMKIDSKFGSTNTVRVRRALRAALADPDVRGILLHIDDSPGGTMAGTADLAAAVAAANLEKPVWAQIDDMGASAAYWVAAQARRIVANATAELGSIGVVAVLEDSSKAMATAANAACRRTASKTNGPSS